MWKLSSSTVYIAPDRRHRPHVLTRLRHLIHCKVLNHQLERRVPKISALVCTEHPDYMLQISLRNKTALNSMAGAMTRLEEKTGLFSSCAAGFGELIAKLLKNMEPTNGLEPLTCRLRIVCGKSLQSNPICFQLC